MTASTPLFSRLLGLLLGLSLMGGLFITLPPQRALADCKDNPNSGVVQGGNCGAEESDTTIPGGAPVGGGGGGGAYCTIGNAPWNTPRTTDYPQPKKSAASSIVAEFDDWMTEALRYANRNWLDNFAVGRIPPSFYWNRAFYDLQSLFMGIDPRSEKLLLQSSSTQYLTQLFKASDRTARDSSETYVQGGLYPLANPGGNVARVLGSASAPLPLEAGSIPLGPRLVNLINEKLSVLMGRPADLYLLLDAQRDNFASAPKYVWDALNASVVSVFRPFPLEIMVKRPSDGAFTVWGKGKLTASTIFPPGTKYYVRAIFPNRTPRLLSTGSAANLFWQVVNREMGRKWVAGGYNFYYYPAFAAPSGPHYSTGEVACGGNWVSSGSEKIGRFQLSFAPPQSSNWWNGCRTLGINSTTMYGNRITNPDSCYMIWARRPLVPPKLNYATWKAQVRNRIHGLDFTSANTPVVIGQTATFSSKSQLPYANFVLQPNQSNMGVLIDFNVTQVGVSAQIGSGTGLVQLTPSGSSTPVSTYYLRRPGATTTPPPYNLQFSIDRTPLSHLQDPACLAQSNAAALQAVCGIAYDKTLREWVYKVTFTTWWDGIYKPAGIGYRGLFTPQWADMGSEAGYRKNLAAGFPTAALGRPLSPSWRFGTSTPDGYGSPMFPVWNELSTVTLRVVQVQPGS